VGWSCVSTTPATAPSSLLGETKETLLLSVFPNALLMAPNLDEDTRPSPATVRGRHMQHVRAGCDECRRRKLRCDGQQPQCALCQEAGIPCELTRGPKKGHLKALKNKVVHLEAMLEGRLLAQPLPEELVIPETATNRRHRVCQLTSQYLGRKYPHCRQRDRSLRRWYLPSPLRDSHIHRHCLSPISASPLQMPCTMNCNYSSLLIPYKKKSLHGC
jgi:hypothetical protein